MKKGVTGNSELVRKINRGLITDAIIDLGCASRTELANKVGLSMPTVMRIVESLIEEGIVIEIGRGNSSGGRKPTLLQLKRDSMYFISACIQRKLKVALADAAGNIVCRHEVPGNYGNVSQNILDQLVECIEAVIDKSSVPNEKIAGAGVGTPGSLFKHCDLVKKYPFVDWAQLDIEAWSRNDRLQYPVEFENIPKLGTLGEMRFGYGRNTRNFIYVYADFGIGSGIMADGKLYMGSSGVAGEFGHTIVDIGGRDCYCGNKGCLEMYCASPAIVHELQEKMRAGSPTILSRICSAEELSFSHVLEALKKNDYLTTTTFEQAGRMLGLGLSNLINLFNPDMIIIGGELSDCRVYVETAKRVAQEGIFLHKANDVRIATSALGSDGLLKGAISLAMNRVFSTISV